MQFTEAVRIAEAAFNDAEKMPLQDIFRINEAMAIVAKEYLAVRDRIMPA